MKLEDLKKSVSSMSDDELRDALLGMRKNRRDNVRASRVAGRKAASKGTETPSSKMRIDPKKMSQTDLDALLDQLILLKKKG